MTAPLTLYQTVDDLLQVRAWIDEHADAIIAAGGELPPELMQLLDAAEGSFESKIERVALFIRELTVTAEAVKAEAERLTALRVHHEKAAASLKAYLLFQLQRVDVQKVAGKLITVRRQKNGRPSVTHDLTPERLAELACLPECQRFIRVVPVQYVVDSDAVVQVWRANVKMGEAAATLGTEDPENTPLLPGVVVTLGEHVRLQ